MGALALLLPGDPHEPVVVLLGKQIPKQLGTVGIGALAHDEGPRFLPETDSLIEAGRCPVQDGGPVRHVPVGQFLTQGTDVLGCGTAAPTHDVQTEFFGGMGHLLREGLRPEVVDQLPVNVHRQARVRQTAQVEGGAFRQYRQRRVHLIGTRTAIEAQHIHIQHLHRGDHRGDIRT